MPANQTASLSMRLIKWVLGLRPAGSNGERINALQHRSYPQDSPLSDGLKRLCEVSTRQHLGQTVVTLTPKKQRSNLRILYLHGGGYVAPLLKPHWIFIRKLIERTGATITVPLYLLAPEHDFQPAFGLVEQLYEQLAGEAGAGQVVIAGDSAGGGFSLALALRIRDRGLPKPHSLLLLAPWVDVSMADSRAYALEAEDPMLRVDILKACGRWWAGALDTQDPRVSPLYGDFSGLPRCIIFQGTSDILSVQVQALVPRLRSAGVEVAYHEYPGGFHVFPAVPLTPEAYDTYAKIEQEYRQASGG